MMSSSTKLAAFLLLTLFFVAHPLHAQSACEDVAGAWGVDLDLPGSGLTHVTLNLEQQDCEVVGFVEGQRKTPIENGTVEGWTANFITMAVNQAGGPRVEIAWEVTVDGTDLVGTFSNPMMGTIEIVGTKVDDR